MGTKSKYTEEELLILKNNVNDIDLLVKLLPDRSIDSIFQKRRRLGIYTDRVVELKSIYGEKWKGKNFENKRCCRCKEFKPKESFCERKDRVKIDGSFQRKTICIKCDNAATVKMRNSSFKMFLAYLFSNTKNDCRKKRGYALDIDVDFLFDLYENQNGVCPLTGIKMTYVSGKGRTYSNISIDRIDNSIGYVKGNVRLVCLWANTAKNDLSNEHFVNLCKMVSSHAV